MDQARAWRYREALWATLSPLVYFAFVRRAHYVVVNIQGLRKDGVEFGADCAACRLS